MAGYSGTPLPQKLGIKEGHLIAILGSPPKFAATLGTLPTGVIATSSLGFRAKTPPLFDVLVVFVKKRADLVAQIVACRPRMQQAAGLWIAWPKKSSGVATDITEDTIREVALPTGLVDNKVCAIDDIWSGLRLVIRKDQRTK